MCNKCNYENLLQAAHLDATENRLRVLEVVGNNSYPLSAADIFKTMANCCDMQKGDVFECKTCGLELQVVHAGLWRI
jgi:hypothetical protein